MQQFRAAAVTSHRYDVRIQTTSSSERGNGQCRRRQDADRRRPVRAHRRLRPRGARRAAGDPANPPGAGRPGHPGTGVVDAVRGQRPAVTLSALREIQLVPTPGPVLDDPEPPLGVERGRLHIPVTTRRIDDPTCGLLTVRLCRRADARRRACTRAPWPWDVCAGGGPTRPRAQYSWRRSGTDAQSRLGGLATATCPHHLVRTVQETGAAQSNTRAGPSCDPRPASSAETSMPQAA